MEHFKLDSPYFVRAGGCERWTHRVGNKVKKINGTRKAESAGENEMNLEERIVDCDICKALNLEDCSNCYFGNLCLGCDQFTGCGCSQDCAVWTDTEYFAHQIKGYKHPKAEYLVHVLRALDGLHQSLIALIHVGNEHEVDSAFSDCNGYVSEILKAVHRYSKEITL